MCVERKGASASAKMKLHTRVRLGRDKLLKMLSIKSVWAAICERLEKNGKNLEAI